MATSHPNQDKPFTRYVSDVISLFPNGVPVDPVRFGFYLIEPDVCPLTKLNQGVILNGRLCPAVLIATVVQTPPHVVNAEFELVRNHIVLTAYQDEIPPVVRVPEDSKPEHLTQGALVAVVLVNPAQG